MKIRRFFLLLIIMVALLTGCKTTQIIQTDKNAVIPATPATGAVRGLALYPEIWINDSPEIMQKNITGFMEKVAGANYNSVYFFVSGRAEKYLSSLNKNNGKVQLTGGFDPITLATESAHKNNLKIYFGIDLSEFVEDDKTKAPPMIFTLAKNKIHNLISDYEIDGLCLIPRDTTTNLIDNLVVEAMLVKPYLVNSLVYSGQEGYQSAIRCQNVGIVDLIISSTDLKAMDPAKDLNAFPDKISVPENLKKITPRQVVKLDLTGLITDYPAGQMISLNRKRIIGPIDSNGQIGFIISDPAILNFECSAGPVSLKTEDWAIPFNYSVFPDSKVVRKSPWVEFRDMSSRNSDLSEYDILFKTNYPSTVKINGDSVKQYKTGIFFNKVAFKEGPNRVRAEIVTKDSLTAFFENEFIYHKTDKTRKTYPLWINERTIEPGYDLELLPEDMVRVSFQGSLGQEAYVEVKPGKIKVKCSREDRTDYSLYTCEIPMKKLVIGKQSVITLKLSPQSGAPDSKVYEFVFKHTLVVKQADDFPFVKITKENSRLVYNLGAPRLGGPIRSELGPGVVMKSNGKFGENYRICLSRSESGFISQNEVQVMPAGTVRPSYYIESLSCGPSKDADVLSIPYSEPVPYEIYPDPDQKRIVITLFGVETSSTWITHNIGRKIIDKITWQQTNPETYQVYVNLKSSVIWGYSFQPEGKRLVLRLKYPPRYDLNNEKPLTGLKIAIEAGHGGSGLGAIGLSGLVEKDVNLDLSFKLGELLKSMGADILQVRDSDKDMGLIEKRNKAIAFKADMLICIHANAGGRGYLSAAGTSTYYNNPFWAPLAENIYNRLLELKLKEFGVIGSFNYTVIRTSQMPAILVEQAFMTNAEDEEKLADPQFRQMEAQKIFEGIKDYLMHIKE